MRIAAIVFSLAAFALQAQDSTRVRWNPVDTVRTYLMRTPGLRLGFDSRKSIMGGVPVDVNGLRYGLDFGKVAVWTGYYNSRLLQTLEQDTLNQGFAYTSSTLEYYVHQSWRFEVVTSFQAGIGNGWEYRKSGADVKKAKIGTIIPLEAGIGGTVRFLRYFGFYAGVGIRVSGLETTNFTGPYWSYGLTYFTGTMYRDAKKWMKKKYK
jgi:hypothetical protein